jgi:hypothetical protein
MTAEVAIINRTAVTLAADSAMTLSIGSVNKINNTTDKIFELSLNDPLGLMIYNNLEFMGVPLDVIAKEFRDSNACHSCISVEQSSTAFLKYLSDNIGALESDQADHAKQLTIEIFKEVKNVFMNELFKLLNQTSVANLNGNIVTKQVEIISRVAELFIEKIKRIKPSECFLDISHQPILDKYENIFDEVIDGYFNTVMIDKRTRELLREVGALNLHRDSFSDFDTGLVFAGYGRSAIFPSLYAYRIDGIINNKLKKRRIREITINRNTSTGHIIPFAQREMVDRFLDGVDPNFERAVQSHLRKSIMDTGTSLINNLKRTSKKTKLELTEKLKESVAVSVKDFREKAVKEIKEDFRSEIDGMVVSMTKQELANFAESLVNITRLKRQVSFQQETVGGPIDVAVISKSDGFVWVNRKHYFTSELNPRFFARKHGIVSKDIEGAVP